MKLKVEIEVTITQEDIDDIVMTAFDSGISYWCYRAVVVGDYLGEWASDQISRGGAVMLHDEDGEHVLNISNFTDALKRVIAEQRLTIEDGRIDTGEIDAEIADLIVQYAVFGELVYC
jgi:hypothetical protein